MNGMQQQTQYYSNKSVQQSPLALHPSLLPRQSHSSMLITNSVNHHHHHNQNLEHGHLIPLPPAHLPPRTLASEVWTKKFVGLVVDLYSLLKDQEGEVLRLQI